MRTGAVRDVQSFDLGPLKTPWWEFVKHQDIKQIKLTHENIQLYFSEILTNSNFIALKLYEKDLYIEDEYVCLYRISLF